MHEAVSAAAAARRARWDPAAQPPGGGTPRPAFGGVRARGDPLRPRRPSPAPGPGGAHLRPARGAAGGDPGGQRLSAPAPAWAPLLENARRPRSKHGFFCFALIGKKKGCRGGARGKKDRRGKSYQQKEPSTLCVIINSSHLIVIWGADQGQVLCQHVARIYMTNMKLLFLLSILHMEASRAQRGLVVAPELPSEDTAELTLQPRAGRLQRLCLCLFLPQIVQVVFFLLPLLYF